MNDPTNHSDGEYEEPPLLAEYSPSPQATSTAVAQEGWPFSPYASSSLSDVLPLTSQSLLQDAP